MDLDGGNCQVGMEGFGIGGELTSQIMGGLDRGYSNDEKTDEMIRGIRVEIELRLSMR